MTFTRFSQLWNALVTFRPNDKNKSICTCGCSEQTKQALAEYGRGNKSKIEDIRKFLNKKNK